MIMETFFQVTKITISMADIHIQRPHELGHTKARAAAEQVALHLQEKYQLNYRWEGDSVQFKRTGVSGYLDVTDTEITLQVRLGFLLTPLRHQIEREIHSYIDSVFDSA